MSWAKICEACKHEKEFDPLTDECPREHDPAECIKRQINGLLKANGMEPSKTEKLKKRRRSRPVVMPEPMPYYDRSSSQYPDRIRVSFADGHTEIYDRRINYPTPGEYVNYPQRRKKG